MTDTVISVRIDKQIHERMKQADHINWSAIIRKALLHQLEEREVSKREKTKRIIEEIKKIRDSRIFDEGKSSVEIIREWRNKRKY